MSARVRAIGCTIVAANYLPYVRVLVEGWRRFHGETPFVTLVVDRDEADVVDEGFDLLAPTEIGIAADELARMRGIYGVAELTTALKPHLLRSLLDAGAGAVLYLDSDTDVHADVLDVAELAERHGVALSPHVIEPFPLDGKSPSEFDLRRYGTFNSGFIAVGPAGRPFLDWWAQRLRRDCLFCEEMGMHADQRWLEWVPLYFNHCVIRDPGLNTGHWNLHEREVTWAEGAFRVGVSRLRTFHFAGFDPESPDMLTWYERPNARYELRAGSDAARLCRDYARRLLAAGYRESRSVPYPFAVSAAGTPLGTWERRAYRETILAAEARGERDLPDPFDPRRSSEFERMLEDPGSTDLLSDEALARVKDARLAQPFLGGDPLTRLRGAVGLYRRFLRRIPGRRRHYWMPYPLPSDLTRNEYASAAHQVGELPLEVPSRA